MSKEAPARKGPGRPAKFKNSRHVNHTVDGAVWDRATAYCKNRPIGVGDLVNCLLELHLDCNEGKPVRLSEPFGILPQYPPAARRG